MIQDYQKTFIQLALRCNALKFGEFTLKSGRVSPYFFNAGLFCRGASIAQLGRCYAAALTDSQVKFDMIFGPAYKGIPLVTTVASALADHHNLDVPFCYDRKEVKDHGEGGRLVGAEVDGNVVIIDDVITAGTAIRGAIETIQQEGATPSAIIVGLNRQERGQGELSAIQELEHEINIPVLSIINLAHIIQYLRNDGDPNTLERIEEYRDKYGTNNEDAKECS